VNIGDGQLITKKHVGVNGFPWDLAVKPRRGDIGAEMERQRRCARKHSAGEGNLSPRNENLRLIEATPEEAGREGPLDLSQTGGFGTPPLSCEGGRERKRAWISGFGSREAEWVGARPFLQ